MTRTSNTRTRAPSRAVTTGTLAGGPVGVLLAWAVNAYSPIPVTPEVSAAIGTLATAAIGYATRGGRRGEAD